MRAHGPAEEACVVRDDSVNSRFREPLHVGGNVDSPDEDLLTRVSQRSDQRCVGNFVVRDDIVDWKPAPGTQLSFRFADQAQGQSGAFGMHGLEHFRQK